MWYLLAFLIGCLWTRTYYAVVKSDWMKSWGWSDNKYYRILHRWNCELCPKHWYCERYEDERKKDEINRL